MAQLEYDTQSITDAVIARLAECQDPRFKQMMTSLIDHLHAFARDVDLKGDEWFKAIEFLTACGKACDDKRQEFILLSDTLGLSMLVVALEHARALKGRSGATPPTDATVQGPFYWEGAPELPLGSDIAEGVPGEPALYSGRVTDLEGYPLKGALLDVWSGDGEGVYDMQREDGGMRARARIRTDDEGRYWFWSIRPTYYPVPTDGPVGDMLRKMGRHPNRPGHIHMKVSAPGHKRSDHAPVRQGQPVPGFGRGVRRARQPDRGIRARTSPAPRWTAAEMDKPYHVAHYDFRLIPQGAA